MLFRSVATHCTVPGSRRVKRTPPELGALAPSRTTNVIGARSTGTGVACVPVISGVK